MDLNELTPELFEKAEFAERRRGYDIDQVESFLEETGTAVAQMLVRFRQTEERANQAEARLADAQNRLSAASQAPREPAPRQNSESDDIERATSTLVMAKRTADATIAEAESEAARLVTEANQRAEAIVSDARRSAEEEGYAKRRYTTEVVTALEARRDAVASVVEGFEKRVEEYRAQFGEAADRLRSIADDPEILSERDPLYVPEAAAGHTPPADHFEQPRPTQQDAVDLTDKTQAHDTVAAAQAHGGEAISAATDVVGAPGGNPEVAPASVEAQVRESSVIVDAEPVTGQTSDRFLRELDEAVNESSEPKGDEEAMSAFFDGEGSERGRSRFGWRR